MARRVYLSAGHGGTDSGAIGNVNGKRYVERDLTIELRDLIVAECRRRGLNIITDPNQNALQQSINFFRNLTSGTCLVIDIHWNASNGQGNGTEIFVPNNPSTFERRLADSLLNALTSFGFRNRGVKTEAQSARKSLGWMRITGENALIEVCFIDNANDMIRYEQNKNAIALRLANAIIEMANSK